jgi:hypothetical protein
MYKSADAGKTWTHIGLEGTRQIGRVVVDPLNPNRVYVAALGNIYAANPERGVFRTVDGGAHWKKVLFDHERPNDVGAVDLAVDPKNPRVLYASLWATRRRHLEACDGRSTQRRIRRTDWHCHFAEQSEAFVGGGG